MGQFETEEAGRSGRREKEKKICFFFFSFPVLEDKSHRDMRKLLLFVTILRKFRLNQFFYLCTFYSEFFFSFSRKEKFKIKIKK